MNPTENENPVSISTAPPPASEAAPQKNSPDTGIVLSKALSVADTLSEAEQTELVGSESVIALGWYTFVDVGLALARIRNGRLYRVEFGTFEAYCQGKWQYGRRYVNQLVSAAEVFTHLGANSSQIKPDHETQLRPLIGLTPEQAQLAWDKAIARAGGRPITSRLMKSAVRELQLTGSTKPTREPSQPKKASTRRAIVALHSDR